MLGWLWVIKPLTHASWENDTFIVCYHFSCFDFPWDIECSDISILPPLKIPPRFPFFGSLPSPHQWARSFPDHAAPDPSACPLKTYSYTHGPWVCVGSFAFDFTVYSLCYCRTYVNIITHWIHIQLTDQWIFDCQGNTDPIRTGHKVTGGHFTLPHTVVSWH